MKKVLILGGTGMLGSMVVHYFVKQGLNISATYKSKENADCFNQVFPNKVEWIKLDAREFVLNSKDKFSFFKNYDWVINCIGITKPFCRDDNPIEIENAIVVNSLFPYKIAEYCSNTRFLQIATDCVFSGIKGYYDESSPHDPIDVYGKTKSLGEAKLENVFNIRCSIIGPELNKKVFLLEWLINNQKGATVKGFIDHFWNGVTTLHFAKLCYGVIENGFQLNNLQHFIPADSISKFELLKTIKHFYRREDINVIEHNSLKSINRTLTVSNFEHNQKMWQIAGYQKIPSIAAMIKELSEYDFISIRN